ncbi:histamine N-methyltransferase-like isoform X2 [Antennarius striatus]|uniref:histamine N-methyltransferase-like isoform X2 n=1 Tax=Antennarius striatus TaxID=241820 RepID=UPI0035B277E8
MLLLVCVFYITKKGGRVQSPFSVDGLFFLSICPLKKVVIVLYVLDWICTNMTTVMESQLRNLISDSNRFLKCLQHYLKHSTEIQTMQDFIDNLLLDIMAKTVNGKSNLNVIGVGSGTGEHDLQMFSTLHHKYPEMTVDNEVIEPNPKQLRDYKDLVSQTPGLDYIKFNWNKMTAEEFEEQWKDENRTKKADLIHMFQDPGATISFFKSLLNKNGQLLITLVSENFGLVKMHNAYRNQLGTVYLSSGDIKIFLDSKGVSYRSYYLPNEVDITKCFIEGDEEGELMIDFLTDVLDFSKTASPELKAGVMEFLGCPEFSVKSSGKVLLNANYEMIVIEQLT